MSGGGGEGRSMAPKTRKVVPKPSGPIVQLMANTAS